MGNTGFEAELRFDICLISIGSVDCPNIMVVLDTWNMYQLNFLFGTFLKSL